MISLKELRQRKGWTQKQLATELNIPPAYGQKIISQWESGRSSPNSSQVQSICKRFGIADMELIVANGELASSFLAVLFENGLEQSEVKFILENKVLHPVVVEDLQNLCVELRDAVGKAGKNPKRK